MSSNLTIPAFTRQTLLTAAGHRPTPAEFSHAWQAATARAEPLLGDLADAYEHGLRKLTRVAAARFKRHAHPLANITASAEDMPKFLIPDQRLIYDDIIAMLALRSATQPLRTKIATTILKDVGVELGLRFDLTNPLFGNALEQVGQKITQISETQRGEIMASLQKSYEAGDSIQHAAQALVEKGNILSIGRAKLISRTEFTSTVNGASLAAAQIGTAARYKQWLATNDDRTRDDHAEADGQVVPIDEPFEVGDDSLMYPGDPSGSVEETANCRCTLIYADNPEGSQTPVASQFGPGSSFAPGGPNPNLGSPDMLAGLIGDWSSNPVAASEVSNIVTSLRDTYDIPFKGVKLDPDRAENFGQLAGKNRDTVFVDPKILDEKFWIARMKKWGGLIVDPSRSGLVIHEFGHILDTELISRDRAVFDQIRTYMREPVSYDVGGKTVTAPRWLAGTGEAPSAYATESEFEWIAEAFTDWHLHGVGAKESSQYVGRLIDQVFRRKPR